MDPYVIVMAQDKSSIDGCLVHVHDFVLAVVW